MIVAFGDFSGSARNYVASRRQRDRQMDGRLGGCNSCCAECAGAKSLGAMRSDESSLIASQIGGIGAAGSGEGTTSKIFVGVATGVTIFLITRFIDRAFFK